MNLLKPLSQPDSDMIQNISIFRRLKSVTSPNVFDMDFFHARTANPFYGYVEVQIDDVNPFYMMTNNDDVIAEFFLWYGKNSYERTTLREWARRAKTAQVIFDVGANTGIFTLVSHFCSDHDKKIVSFEPTSRAYARVVENCNVNNIIDKVKIEKVALSDQDGIVEFQHFENATRISSGASYVEGVSHFEIHAREQCERTTLDAYIEKTGIFPDLMKIDVEGAEVDVMKGASQLIAKRATTFIIEVIPATCDKVIEHFDGYDVYLLDDHANRASVFVGPITHHVNLLIEPKAS